jgi:hypothetical protein
LVATVVSNPVIGLGLALASHLLLDVIPHFGVDPRRLKLFLPVLLVDMLLAASVLLTIIISQPADAWYLVACGVVASSPDLLNLPFFVSLLRRREHRFGIVQRFLTRIQKSETVPGLAVEIVWFLVTGSLLVNNVW